MPAVEIELIRGLHNLRERHRGCVLSIGNFDGLHLGHQALLSRLRDHAGRLKVPAAVLTFEPTAREFFAPGQGPGRVSPFRDKLRGLAKAGVTRVLCVRFDRRFAAITAEGFIEGVLARGLGVCAIVVGGDFRFGAGRAGDFGMLQSYGKRCGYIVEAVGTVTVDGERISSTALRAALAQPDLGRAQRLLGRPYRIGGRVRRGLKLARRLDMPTVNLPLKRPPALRYGIYAVRVYAEGRLPGIAGVANLGVRPTIGDGRCLLEVHVLGGAAPGYGDCIEVEFCRYQRPEARFESLDALAAQMREDRAQAQKFFESTGNR